MAPAGNRRQSIVFAFSGILGVQASKYPSNGRPAAQGGLIRYRVEAEESEEGARRKSVPKEEDLNVEEVLLSHLQPLIKHDLITEVVRPIKSGKEAVVYCCRAHPSLERELVAAKVYRPFEMRSFKRDGVYQQGRERGARPDARTMRALGKKTRRGKLHKFNAWIAHEMRTLQIMHEAGADVPEPIERRGPVILLQYIGDSETPAPVLVSVDLDPREAQPLYNRILENVDIFLARQRVHADLSPYNMLYWNERITIIDFPQAVDPRYNDSAFDLLIRDIANVNAYFAEAGASVVDPIEHALSLWRKHVDPQR